MDCLALMPSLSSTSVVHHRLMVIVSYAQLAKELGAQEEGHRSGVRRSAQILREHHQSHHLARDRLMPPKSCNAFDMMMYCAIQSFPFHTTTHITIGGAWQTLKKA